MAQTTEFNQISMKVILYIKIFHRIHGENIVFLKDGGTTAPVNRCIRIRVLKLYSQLTDIQVLSF